MKHYILLICVFAFSLNINAQDIFKNYKPIESSGNIPTEFTTKSSETVKDEIDDFTSGEKGKTKKHKKEFLISSTFSTKKVLLSGKVLFNDPVTKYINKVADVIFKANKDLNKNDFKIYAYKTPIVNAVAFNDGLVLINLGLIAQLENEAQLALILCHEFTHVVNNDNIDDFLTSKEIESGKGEYKNTSYSDKMLYKSKYSIEIESTADKEGLEYYKKTKYSLKPVNGVFDVLKYAYLPFDEIPFDTTYFEKGKYVFPSDYTLTEINPISTDGQEADDEDEDILKSHPDVEDRREDALEVITLKELKDKTRKVFIATQEKEFKKIRNICRFEMPRMYLMHGYYEMAFYNAFLLEELGFKNNIYLDKQKAKAIGQMARSVNNGERPSKSDLKDIEEDMQGESQQVYYFLNSLARKKKEFNVFAVEYTYSILKKYPKDEELKKMFSSILYEMYEETNLKYTSFKKTYPGMKIAKVEPNVKDSADLEIDKDELTAKEQEEKEKIMNEIRGKDSKYKRIEKKVEKQEEEAVKVEKSTKKSKNNYYKYAFVDFMTDKKFTKEARKVEKAYKAEKNTDLSKEEQKEKDKNDRLDRNRGLALGIDKIIVIDPYFTIIHDKKVKLYRSEKAQEEYNAIIDKMSKKTKIDLQIIDINNLNSNNSQVFNDITVLDEIIGEQYLFDDPLGFSSIEKDRIDNIVETYGTKYFLWSGGVSFMNQKYTMMFNLLFNIETGELLLEDYKNIHYSINKNIVKSELYHVLDQIKTNRKTK